MPRIKTQQRKRRHSDKDNIQSKQVMKAAKPSKANEKQTTKKSFDLILQSGKKNNPTQYTLFDTPHFDTLAALIDQDGQPATLIISCGRSKKTESTTAHQMYTSVRFQTAYKTATALEAPCYILSGLHGLMHPDNQISPYNFDLTTSNARHIKTWSSQVLKFLTTHSVTRKICLLATKSYSDAFIDACSSFGKKIQIVAPLASLDESLHEEWTYQALIGAKRYRDLKKLYQLITIARERQQVFKLGELGKRSLPTRGVYLFIDPNESNFLGAPGRIVRIGTHAISDGSKATLKSRLKNHLGLRDGSGNHRGSIFRLHVGRALLEQSGESENLPSWGKGQHAPLNIRIAEKTHEIRVSQYIASLDVFILDVDDKSSKHSLRATIERQLIALCSESLQPIDHASNKWLGRYSPMPNIAKSGLWNLRDIGRPYEPDSPGSVNDLINLGGDA